jgi:hypothetical protein
LQSIAARRTSQREELIRRRLIRRLDRLIDGLLKIELLISRLRLKRRLLCRKLREYFHRRQHQRVLAQRAAHLLTGIRAVDLNRSRAVRTSQSNRRHRLFFHADPPAFRRGMASMVS